jgi:hypothetical protein
MPCTNCGLTGHNKRTCLQNINTLDDITINSTKKTYETSDCVICFNKIKNKLETSCNHTFCSKCIFTNISHGNFHCPLCRNLLVNPKLAIVKKYKRKIRKLKIENSRLRQCLQHDISNINNESRTIVV